MEENNREKWIEAALKHVRCRPVHEELWAELMGHIEDKIEDLTASGLIQEDAENLALRAMGDPKEVGKALNKVYNPIWWWLLDAAKIIVLLALAFIPVMWVLSPVSLDLYDRGRRTPAWYVDNGGSYYREDSSDWCGGYYMTVIRSYLRETDQGVDLCFTVQAISPFPGSEGEGPNLEACWAEDSQGNHYGPYGPFSGSHGYRIGVFTYYCDVYITNFDPDAEWLELRYESEGRELCLRVEMEEVATYAELVADLI